MVSVVVGVIGLPGALANWRRSRSERSVTRFERTLDHARRQQSRLMVRVWLAERDDWKIGHAWLLTKPGWVLAHPVPLSAIRLRLLAAPRDDHLLDAARSKARDLLPYNIDGARYSGYSQALLELGGMRHLFNGRTYRPVDVRPRTNGMDIDFYLAHYFDHLDTSTLLTYEVARQDLRNKRSIIAVAYRQFLGDPFDFRRRSTGLGINTLTVRRGQNGCGFYMHRRDGRWVAEGPEVVHVVPAGEFTPSDVSLDAQRDDFSLWRNIMREYAEELLGLEEAYGKGGKPLDYAHQSPFRELNDARKSNRLAVYTLGIGLDPLDWKPGLLTICIIDADVFDDVFAGLVSPGKEGVILVGEHGRGIPFAREAVDLYADNPGTVAAGSACLRVIRPRCPSTMKMRTGAITVIDWQESRIRRGQPTRSSAPATLLVAQVRVMEEGAA